MLGQYRGGGLILSKTVCQLLGGHKDVNVQIKYSSFSQEGSQTVTKQYSFTAQSKGKVIVYLNSASNNPNVSTSFTRYVKKNNTEQTINYSTDSNWQVGGYCVVDVEPNDTIEAYASKAISGNLNSVGLFVAMVT